MCIIACNFWLPCCECHLMSATWNRVELPGPNGERQKVREGKGGEEQCFTIFIGIPCILVSLMWVSFRVSCSAWLLPPPPFLNLPCLVPQHAIYTAAKQNKKWRKNEGNSSAINVNKYPVPHTRTHTRHTRTHTHAAHTCTYTRPPASLYAFLAKFAPMQTPTAKLPPIPCCRPPLLTMPSWPTPLHRCPVVQRAYCRR